MEEILSGEKRKILIIDDEETLADFIEKILLDLKEHFGDIEIQKANNGRDGIMKTQEFLPDVVLLDIKLPDISGVEVLSEIKRIDPDIQVIMMTGFASLETAVASIREGAYDYINKPFESADQLKTIVKNAIERRILIVEKKILLSELQEVNDALTEANRMLEEKKALVDKQLEEKIQELQKLNAFSRTLSTEFNTSKIINIIYNETKNITGSNACLLMLMDRKRNNLIVTKSDENFDVKSGEIIGIGDKPYGLVDNDGAWSFKNTICAPVKFGEEKLGVICVQLDEPSSVKELIETIASYSAVALHNSLLFESLKTSYIESLTSLLKLEEAVNPSLKEHSLRVSELSVKISNELKLTEEYITDIRYAAILHDLGGIVDKEKGYFISEQIINPIKFLKNAANIIKNMNEKYSVSKDEIPIGSRIIAVANRFDELILEGKNEKEAFNEIEKLSEKDFDPEVVECLKKILKKKGIEI
uniref:Response regulator n=1 Tax=candidate division WOR-3 bacterium TaxID=2052148 RepID=A0A7C4YFX3_UNCW3